MLTSAPQLDSQNPWPGLLPFNEAAEHYFHGRDAEVAHLLRLVQRQALTVLFGKSGLGKTSLLLAGLFPRLRACQFLPIYIRLELHEGAIDPRRQIWAALADNSQRYRIEGREPGEGDTLWEFFHHRDADFWDGRNRLVTPVLVVDQFEEVLTLADPARVQPLLDSLGDLVENRMPDAVKHALDAYPERAAAFEYGREGCKVLLSFREDYLPEFERLRPLMPSLADERMRLVPMNGRQARDAILAAGGDLFAPGIAERIIGFVASSSELVAQAALVGTELERMEIEPALLSVVCRELNNKRLQAGAEKITDALLAETPGEIIEGFYNSAVADVDEAGRRFIEDQLITSAGFRDSRALADALTQPGVTRSVIDRLVERRVLRLEERLGTLRVELTHDRLTSVIRRQRDRRRQVEAERVRAERTEAAILREREQREMQERFAADANARAREARRQFVRMRVLAGAALCLLGVAAGAFAWAFIEQRTSLANARLAEQQKQVAEQNAVFAEQQKRQAEQNSKVAENRQKQAENYLQLAIQGANNDVNLILNNFTAGRITPGIARSMLENARNTFSKAQPDEVGPKILGAQFRLFATLAATYEKLSDLGAALQAAQAMKTVAEKLAASVPDDGTGQESLITAHIFMSLALGGIGDLSAAAAEYSLASDLLQKPISGGATQDWKMLAAVARQSGGFLFSLQHRWPDASDAFRQATALYREIEGKTHRPDEKEATSRSGLAYSIAKQGNSEAALKEWQQAETLVVSLQHGDATNADLDQYLARIDVWEAEILAARGDVDAARKYHGWASGLISALQKRGVAPEDAIALWGRQEADIMRKQGNLDVAIQAYGYSRFLASGMDQGQSDPPKMDDSFADPRQA